MRLMDLKSVPLTTGVHQLDGLTGQNDIRGRTAINNIAGSRNQCDLIRADVLDDNDPTLRRVRRRRQIRETNRQRTSTTN